MRGWASRLMRILSSITSENSKKDSFESILSIIYSVFYCVWDTQGIPDSLGHPLTLP